MTLKSQTLAAKCRPRRLKCLPKVTLKRESWIFKNICFTKLKHYFLRLRHLPNLPKKQVKEFDQLFDTTNTKKWASWLQSASQWAPPGDPKFTEFHQKIDLGSQRAAFGARSCTKAAKMVLRPSKMTHFPFDYQSNLIAGGAYSDWNWWAFPWCCPRYNSSAWFVGRGETPKVDIPNQPKIHAIPPKTFQPPSHLRTIS